MGLVQLVVAAFGLRGSKDASKIGPFRILIWGISLVILATILYGWFFNGNWYIQNSPLLLIGNVIYLLVCSTLADAVKREHDLGIVGEAKAEVERSGSQKALRVISIVLVVFAVISIVLGLAFLALIAAGLGTDAVNAMDPNGPGSGGRHRRGPGAGRRAGRQRRRRPGRGRPGPARRSRSAEGQAVLRAVRHRPGHRGRRRRLARGAGACSRPSARAARWSCWSSAPARGWPYDIMRQSRGIEA